MPSSLFKLFDIYQTILEDIGYETRTKQQGKTPSHPARLSRGEPQGIKKMDTVGQTSTQRKLSPFMLIKARPGGQIVQRLRLFHASRQHAFGPEIFHFARAP